MNFDSLRAKISDVVGDNWQRKYTAGAAIDSIESGLTTLAGLGHRFDLVEGDPAPIVEFPKAFYHQAHGFAVAEDSAKAAELLAAGWQDKPIGETEVNVPEVVAVPEPEPISVPVTVDIAAAMAAGQIVPTPDP